MTKTLFIQRITGIKDGTFGVLLDNDIPFALTIEPPWRNNEDSISCIPNGTYICKRVASARFGNTFKVTDVPERSDILFHWGNVSNDTKGCILVGEEFGSLRGKTAVLSSKRGFDEFLKRLQGVDKFILIISDV